MGRTFDGRLKLGMGRLALLIGIAGGVAAGAYLLFVMLRPLTPEPRAVPQPMRSEVAHHEGEACGRTELTAEFDGDGLTDRVAAWSVLLDEGASCSDPRAERSYRVAVVLGTGERLEGNAPACRWPHRCVLIAAPDLDADGRAEIALSPWAGASTVGVRLYEVTLSDTETPLEAIEVAPPGDPSWGHRPGPAEFTLYGSVTHLGALRCHDTLDGSRQLTAVGMALEGNRYRMHQTTFSLEGTSLMVTNVRDYAFSSYEDPRLRQAEQRSDLCGAPIGNV